MAVSQGKMIAILLLAGVLQCASAAIYTVGDATEWTFPPTDTFYDDWAKNHTFIVGDQLVFKYTAPVHDVYQVSEAGVANCDRANPIQTWTESDATVTLTSTGYHGYICSLTGHCEGSMKMNLQVVAAADSPTSTPAAAPSTTTPPPPPSTPTTTAPPPSSTPEVAGEGPGAAAPTSDNGAFSLHSGSALSFGILAAGCVAFLFQI